MPPTSRKLNSIWGTLFSWHVLDAAHIKPYAKGGEHAVTKWDFTSARPAHVARPQLLDAFISVLWEDNYLSLMPDESRVVVARFHNSSQKLERPQLEVSGWNIEAMEIPLQRLGETRSIRKRSYDRA
jgi:Exo-beta-D-glucosaminidase Ig-fold domain